MFNSADGINESDTFVTKAGAHAHQSMAFSEAGTYRVSFDISGSLAADGKETRSCEFQLLFEVEEKPYNPIVAAVYNLVEDEWELVQVNEDVSDDWVALYDTTVVEGQAEPDVDYASNGLRIEFPIDASMATVLVPIIDDIETLLTDNRIFKQRNVQIGIVTKEEALAHSFSGVMLRGSGVAWDLRKSQPYECYKELDFKIPIDSAILE